MAQDLSNLSLAELRAGLQKREFSARELTDDTLRRMERHADLNTFITVCEAEARVQAEEADKALATGGNGALLGIPIALKDIILSKGVRTTCASKMLAEFISPYDATVTRKIRAAGGVVIGKTNMDEFAMGSSNENSAYGSVHNPWKRGFVPGGSSGGSAAAVAARLVPAALGTDTGGSIRQPASFCSVVGIKPTYGRVSRYGVVAFASSLDQVGPFAATVEDCAILCEVLSGHDPLDSTSMPQPVPALREALGKEVRGLRLGMPKEYFIDGLAPEVEEAVRAAVRQFEQLGCEIVEVSLPHTEAAVATYYILAPAEASSNLARFDGVRYGHRTSGKIDLETLYAQSRAEGFGSEVKRRIMIGTYVLSSGYYDAFYLQAQKVRTLIKQDFSNAFEKQCDAIISPVAPTTAFKIGEKVTDPLAMYLGDAFTIPVNLAGLPGMSVPCGFDKEGLPIGVQLIGRPWDEETLFRLAAAYEAATDWHRARPTLETAAAQ